MIASGFFAGGHMATTASVFRSKTVTSLVCPSLTKPRFELGCDRDACTPRVSGIVPTMVPLSASSTSTWVPCETYNRRLALVHSEVVEATVAGHGDGG